MNGTPGSGIVRATLACTLLAAMSSAPCVAAERPNIVVILADDMGFSDLGCYGGEIETPNLNRLAENGLRFTQFYNTGRCCPTRASLLTGLYPHQAGVGHMMDDRGHDGYRGDLNRRCVTIAEVLRPAGYATFAVGKWHVTKTTQPDGPKDNWPLQRGFDRFYGTITGAGSFYDPGTLTRDNTMISPFADPEYQPQRYYYTDAISDHAVRFVEEHAGRHAEKPFFLYVAYTAAHWPMHALDEDIARYEGKYDGGYEPVRRQRFERLRQMGLIEAGWELSPQAGDWEEFPHKEWEARCMEVYAAMIDRMDQGIGRIVEALEKNGELENTLLLFLEDNGGCQETVGRKGGSKRPVETSLPEIPADAIRLEVIPKQNRAGVPTLMGPQVMPGPEDTYIAYGPNWANVSNTPFREYKHFVHEGGISTPLIAHWPQGIERRGELEHQPGHLIDLMATCVAVSGAEYPGEKNGEEIQPMEGVSLVAAFEGRPLDRPNPIFWEHEGNRAVRVGRWKLVAKENRPWELYDMQADRTEMHNLAGEQPQRVREMAALWDAWAERANVLPLGAWRGQRGANGNGGQNRPTAQRETSAGSRPNFLLFIADDMSYHDLGCWGNRDVRTPNLDRLAGQGMRLLRCFTPAPTCSPTRHALYTGLYPVRSGAHPNHAIAKPGTRSLPHYLSALGYRVGLIGKTHIGPAESYPFEILGGRVNLDYEAEDDPAAEKIREFINRDPEQPYCLVVASNEPHEPWTKGDSSAYEADMLTLPPYFVDTPETRTALTKYYAEITHMDAQVGRCMELVDKSPRAENTLFLFLSEQGSSFPHCKWTLYDTGIRAAAIARWPARVKPASASEALVQYVDVVPTVIEAAGGKPVDRLDGRNFLRVLTGRIDRHRDYVYGIQTSRGIINGPEAYGIRCVRDGRYKYILNLNAENEFSNMLTGRHRVVRSWRRKAETDPFAREQVERYTRRPEVEFYDLQSDPFEMTNLADRPESREQMARLREQLDAWMQQQGDRGVETEMAALEHMTPGARQRFLRQLEPQSDERSPAGANDGRSEGSRSR